MTAHTRSTCTLATLLLALTLTAPAHADPTDPAPEPLPWTGATDHVVCDVGIASLDHTLSVAAWERPEDLAVLTVASSGWYWLFDGSDRDRRVLERSDVAWIRVSNPTNPEGVSAQRNCGDEWVPTGAARPYLGLFWLEKGRNAVTLHHACPLIRMGVCADFDQGRPGTSCRSFHANTVTLGPDALCAMRAE